MRKSLDTAIPKQLSNAIDIIGVLSPKVAAELKSHIKSGKELVLVQEKQTFTDCEIARDPKRYIRTRMMDIRRQLVGPLVPQLYRAYLQNRYGNWFKKAGFNPKLVDGVIDYFTDLYVTRVVDEMVIPSVLKFLGVDVESMRDAFNRSLHTYAYNETLTVESESKHCLAMIELPPTPPTIHKPKRRKVETRKRAVKKLVNLTKKIVSKPSPKKKIAVVKKKPRIPLYKLRLSNQQLLRAGVVTIGKRPDKITRILNMKTRKREQKSKSGPSGWSAKINPDGSVTFKDNNVGWAKGLALVFDVTDLIMRTINKDPYASAKLAFLKKTRAKRMLMRKAWRRKVEFKYLNTLKGRLTAIWKRSGWTYAKKRAVIMKLWDECLEPGNSSRRRGAQLARSIIIRFVRKNLPKGTSHAYTAQELSLFNGRRAGMVKFKPY